MNEEQMVVGVRVRVCRDIVIGEVGGGGGYVIDIPEGRLGTVERLPVGMDHEDAIRLVHFDDPVCVSGSVCDGPVASIIVWKACVPECTAEDFELVKG